MKKDIEHLNLLAIFHYITAGLTLLLAVFPLIYVAVGVMFVMGAAQRAGVVYGWFFIVVGGGCALFLAASAVAIAIAGWSLARHKNRVFCFVVAGLLCLGAPLIFPLILGIFTIVVLCRPSVRDLFAGMYRFHDPEDEDDLPDRPALPSEDRPQPRRGDRGIYSPRCVTQTLALT
jgi:hypothetical protein